MASYRLYDIKYRPPSSPRPGRSRRAPAAPSRSPSPAPIRAVASRARSTTAASTDLSPMSAHAAWPVVRRWPGVRRLDCRGERRCALRRHLGGAAHLRRGREPARHRARPSSTRCRVPPCSSSTTPRPMAPASWPTAWRPPMPRMRVRHRPGKQGLGKAYIDGFARGPAGGRRPHRADGRRLVALPDYLPALHAPDGRLGRAAQDGADLVIGSRYVARRRRASTGASVRRIVSRGGSLFARIVLRLTPHDLTGGFKAWRRAALEVHRLGPGPLGRLRLPDRDDLPRQRPARASWRCPSSSPTGAWA